MDYLELFLKAFLGTVKWTWRSITFDVPWHQNYFWGLIVISLVVFALEVVFPWRKEQKIFRKDFWLDGFYMFFNFFIFSIVIAGFYKVLELTFANVGLENTSLRLINMSALPEWAQLIIVFVVLVLSFVVERGFGVKKRDWVIAASVATIAATLPILLGQ